MIAFEILTLFPEFFHSPLRASILGKAQERGLLSVSLHNIRDYTEDRHHITDDYPFGGGAGMIMKPEPVVEALEKIRGDNRQSCAILLTPQGDRLNQVLAEELVRCRQIILVCGRYEGVDERIRVFVDREISVGDYVLNGGESAALVLLEVISRLLPGVLGKDESPRDDSFSTGLIEYPQYTRPREFRGHVVPEILTSGDHEKIRQWRLRESLKRTLLRRPDLLETKELSLEEESVLSNIKHELSSMQGNKYERFRSH